MPAFGCDAMTKVLPFIFPSIITIFFFQLLSVSGADPGGGSKDPPWSPERGSWTPLPK